MNHPSKKFRSVKRNSLQILGPKKMVADNNLVLTQSIHQLNNKPTVIAETHSITLQKRRQSQVHHHHHKIKRTWNNENHQQQINHLKAQLLRNSDLLRIKNMKLQDSESKLAIAQKQIEETRKLVSRNQILKKNNQTLQKKMIKLQKSLQECALQIEDKTDEILRLKQTLGVIKVKLTQQDVAKTQVVQKQKQITHLNQKCKTLDAQCMGQIRTSNFKHQQNKILQDQIDELKRRLRQSDLKLNEVVRQRDNLKKQLLQSDLVVKRLSYVESTLTKQEKTLRQAQTRLSKIDQPLNKCFEQYQQIKQKLQAKIQSLFTQNQQIKRKQINSDIVIYKYEQKMQLFNTKIDRADYIFKQMLDVLKCTVCKQNTQQAVTFIPCGHSVCLQCSNDLQKQCNKCQPNVAIEKYHRNQIIDAMNFLMQNHQQMIEKIKQ